MAITMFDKCPGATNIRTPTIEIKKCPECGKAAAFLAKAGRDVLLLDKAKFPRDKPCGDGQGLMSVDLLKEIGIKEEFFYGAGRQYLDVILGSPDDDVCTMSSAGRGFCTPRKVLDAAVKDAAVACGAEIMEEFQVTDLLFDDGQVCGVRGKYQSETVEFQAKIKDSYWRRWYSFDSG